MGELYGMVCRAAEGFPELQIGGGDVDRPVTTVSYEKKQTRPQADVNALEGANGRQER
jgi:hypothetical protein